MGKTQLTRLKVLKSGASIADLRWRCGFGRVLAAYAGIFVAGPLVWA